MIKKKIVKEKEEKIFKLEDLEKSNIDIEIKKQKELIKEIVKVKPNSSGTTEPKTIPKIVDICQIVQHVKPAPNK